MRSPSEIIAEMRRLLPSASAQQRQQILALITESLLRESRDLQNKKTGPTDYLDER